MARAGRLLVAISCGVGSACAHRDPSPSLQAGTSGGARVCVAPDTNLQAHIDAEKLPGNYRLTLVATSGARAGRSSEGSLSLGPRAGHAAIDLGAVGAIAPGDIGSTDPARPGVLIVLPNASAPSPIVLRFGADANTSEHQLFDGSHMALFIAAATASGITGSWTSGVDTRSAAGHFCAERA